MQLAERLRQSDPVFAGWSTIPAPTVVASLARAGFDAVVVDMQHGLHDEHTALHGPLEAARGGVPAVLRIPVGRIDLASRALDAGYEAVIAPMINSVAEARAFAAAMKYPPVGDRSWGPFQALSLNPTYTAGSYYKSANTETLAIAMIETRHAIEVYRDILAIDGIDGLFVGPSDLSISWTEGGKVDPELPEMQGFLAELASATLEAGKVPAIYAVTPESAARYAGMGYKLISAASDEAVISTGAMEMLNVARKPAE